MLNIKVSSKTKPLSVWGETRVCAKLTNIKIYLKNNLLLFLKTIITLVIMVQIYIGLLDK